jgi:hypothetical protein
VILNARRICWPPDATCLAGDCSHCNQQPFRSLASITRWVNKQGLLMTRRRNVVPARTAWWRGVESGFPKVEKR